MKIPSLKQAIDIINEGRKLYNNPWIEHSFFTASAAQNIALQIPDLDPEVAYILGPLHDIGRIKGPYFMRHILDGYSFLTEKGFDDSARICMTHSFHIKDINAAFPKWDCSQDELDFIKSYLLNIEYNEYDRLIQLCDLLALPTGFSLLEKRMVDIALRYGTNNYTIPIWKEVFKLKNHFKKITKCSIYDLLPGVIENTFDIKQKYSCDK
ncbi:MAG: HD domain-containing protein [Clostridiaceae bacterium]